MEFLQFMFSSWWTFLGMMWLMYGAFCGIARVVAAWRHGKLDL
jgi:hypothetical protein